MLPGSCLVTVHSTGMLKVGCGRFAVQHLLQGKQASS